jgi:hypothetical protein
VLTVIGKGFLPTATASIGSGVTVGAVAVISETEMQVSVSVDPGASSGARVVLIWAPATGPRASATSFAVGRLFVG